MLGRTIEAKAPLSRWAWVWLIIAVVLVVWAAVERNPHPAIAAILPAMVAVGLWFGRPRSVVVTLDRDGLIPLGAAGPISYESITSVSAGGTPYLGGIEDLPARPIEIYHGTGVLVVPQQMNVPTLEFVRFVHERLPPPDERPIPAKLADHAAEQRAKFGIDKVEIIRVRGVFKEHWHRQRNRSLAIAMVLTSIAWVVLALAIGPFVDDGDSYGIWLVLGGLCVVVAGLVAFAVSNAKSASQQLVAKHPYACVVISPTGIAMSQAGLEGVMPWSQVRGATTQIPQFLRTRRVNGVRLAIDGGEIIVLDIYDRSPYEIERLIRSRLDRPTT